MQTSPSTIQERHHSSACWKWQHLTTLKQATPWAEISIFGFWQVPKVSKMLQYSARVFFLALYILSQCKVKQLFIYLIHLYFAFFPSGEPMQFTAFFCPQFYSHSPVKQVRLGLAQVYSASFHGTSRDFSPGLHDTHPTLLVTIPDWFTATIRIIALLFGLIHITIHKLQT